MGTLTFFGKAKKTDTRIWKIWNPQESHAGHYLELELSHLFFS